MSQPLTDAIEALTTYANSVTGESDATLSEAVATLASGYGSGGINIDDIVSGSDFLSGDITLTATIIRDYAFAYLAPTSTYKVFAPNCTYIGHNAFRDNRQCTEVHLPALTSYGATSYIFFAPSSSRQNNLLELIDWGFCNVPGNWARYNTNLTKIILRKTDSVATLTNIGSLQNTPFYTDGTGGTVYVPSALISSYQTASNWSTLYQAGTCSFEALEGSIYE